MHLTRPFQFFFLSSVLLAISVRGSENQLEIRYIDNSPGISQIIDINRGGMAIGTKEVKQGKSLLATVPFFHDGQKETSIPLFDGYTSLQVERMNDRGMIVGFAGRVPTTISGAFQGFLWTSGSNQLESLGWLTGYRDSSAFDVSEDGLRITGICVGANPPRIVPCLWEQLDGQWKCQWLATPRQYNPFLRSGRVVISDDGETIAACAYGRIDLGEYSNHLFIWRRTNNAWKRTRQIRGALHLANINNDGLIAGTLRGNEGERAFVFDEGNGFQLLDLLPGDAGSSAMDINNDGMVVGYSDDPYGPVGGPQAFVWTNGKLQPLPLPPDVVFSAAACITDTNLIGGYAQLKGNDADDDRTVSFVLSDRTKSESPNDSRSKSRRDE